MEGESSGIVGAVVGVFEWEKKKNIAYFGPTLLRTECVGVKVTSDVSFRCNFVSWGNFRISHTEVMVPGKGNF